MKTTVSVPDDLWKRAHRDDETPSALVQRALRALVEHEESQRGPFASAPSGVDEDLERAKESRLRLIEQARQLRRSGYSTGLAVLQQVRWNELEEVFNRLPSVDDLAEGILEEWLSREPRVDDADLSHGALLLRYCFSQVNWDEFSEEEHQIESVTYRQGIAAALFDTWRDISRELKSDDAAEPAS